MDHSSIVPVERVEPGAKPLARTTAYEAPSVIFEASLEVRAGSPLNVDPLDLFE